MSHRLNNSFHFFQHVTYLFICSPVRPCTHTLVLIPAQTNTTVYKRMLECFGVLLLIHDAPESSCPFQTLFYCFSHCSSHCLCKDSDIGPTASPHHIKGGSCVGGLCVSTYVGLHASIYTLVQCYYILYNSHEQPFCFSYPGQGKCP